jgi:hypothetical protein
MRLFVGPQRLRYSAILGLTSALSAPADTANLAASQHRHKRNGCSHSRPSCPVHGWEQCTHSSHSPIHPVRAASACICGESGAREPAGNARLLRTYHNHFADPTPSPCETRLTHISTPSLPLRRLLAVKPIRLLQLDPRPQPAQHGASTALQTGEHSVRPALNLSQRRQNH